LRSIDGIRARLQPFECAVLLHTKHEQGGELVRRRDLGGEHLGRRDALGLCLIEKDECPLAGIGAFVVERSRRAGLAAGHGVRPA
jgi:hypothetical protein